MIKNIVKTVTVGTFLMSSFALSAQSDVASSDTKSSASIVSTEQIINLAGQQRMFSQRMAKDYFYVGKKINRGNASRQLADTLKEFKKTQIFLNKNIKDEEIRNLIAFVDMSLDEFIAISKEPYSVDNGTIILDLSESMLEGSGYIVQAIVKDRKTNEIIDTAGKQRMLSQRIGKYYIAYQAGIKDDNTIVQMKDTVKEFDSNLKKLMSNISNTDKIKSELAKVNKMWRIVYKFYLNIEKGGLPVIVYSTTDDITTKMDKIVSLYVNILEKK